MLSQERIFGTASSGRVTRLRSAANMTCEVSGTGTAHATRPHGMRWRFQPHAVPDAAVLDDHKPRIRLLERCGSVGGSLSLGPLAMPTGWVRYALITPIGKNRATTRGSDRGVLRRQACRERPLCGPGKPGVSSNHHLRRSLAISVRSWLRSRFCLPAVRSHHHVMPWRRPGYGALNTKVQSE